MRQFRALILNPRPRPPKWRPPDYRKIYRWSLGVFKRHFLLIFILTIASSLIIGFLTVTGSVLNMYDNYGIEDVFDRPSGWLWDLLWWWRGQPAGWEDRPDALFPFEIVIKADPLEWIAGILGQDVTSAGLNGPLTLWGMTTEWFVDLTIYLPKFADPAFLLLNVDLLWLFFIKFSIDMGILVGVLVVMVVLSPVIAAILAFLLPYIIQWVFAVAGPLLKIILIITMIGGLFLALTGQLEPLIKGIQDFFNEFIRLLGG